MWHQDDDTALTLSRQMHTVGHPNFLPADERAAASNNQAAAQADEAPPTAAVSDDDAIYSDDEDLIESQVEACPPTHVTPSKRRRPNSPTAKEVAATSATRTYDAKSDTNLILFTVAPFTIESEFRALLLEWFVKDAAHLGYVRLVRKREEETNFYLVAELFDEALGQSIIEALSSNDYCHVPLCPEWIPAASWGHFYTIYSKQCSHSNLDRLATSTMIQRLKCECPTSHHQQFDELLCSTSDSSTIMSTYQSWFGSTAFSPFGTIENSNF
jgi:hypothetical protein